MKNNSSLRRLWRLLPQKVRYAIFATYLSVREVLLLPRLVWKTPGLGIARLDYETYWKTRGESAFQPRFQVISEIIAEDSTVLEIGCGDGLCMEFLERTRRVKGTGYDVSEVSIKLAKERGLNVEIADVTSNGFRVESVYDYVLACEVLEHLSDPEALIAKVRGNYRRALIISIPNIGYFSHRLRLLFGRFPLQWVVHPSEHLWYWSVLDFRWWVREMGLQITEVKGANGIRVLNLHRWWPNLFANDIVYVITEGSTLDSQRET